MHRQKASMLLGSKSPPAWPSVWGSRGAACHQGLSFPHYEKCQSPCNESHIHRCKISISVDGEIPPRVSFVQFQFQTSSAELICTLLNILNWCSANGFRLLHTLSFFTEWSLLIVHLGTVRKPHTEQRQSLLPHFDEAKHSLFIWAEDTTQSLLL